MASRPSTTLLDKVLPARYAWMKAQPATPQQYKPATAEEKAPVFPETTSGSSATQKKPRAPRTKKEKNNDTDPARLAQQAALFSQHKQNRKHELAPISVLEDDNQPEALPSMNERTDAESGDALSGSSSMKKRASKPRQPHLAASADNKTSKLGQRKRKADLDESQKESEAQLAPKPKRARTTMQFEAELAAQLEAEFEQCEVEPRESGTAASEATEEELEAEFEACEVESRESSTIDSEPTEEELEAAFEACDPDSDTTEEDLDAEFEACEIEPADKTSGKKTEEPRSEQTETAEDRPEPQHLSTLDSHKGFTLIWNKQLDEAFTVFEEAALYQQELEREEKKKRFDEKKAADKALAQQKLQAEEDAEKERLHQKSLDDIFEDGSDIEDDETEQAAKADDEKIENEKNLKDVQGKKPESAPAPSHLSGTSKGLSLPPKAGLTLPPGGGLTLPPRGIIPPRQDDTKTSNTSKAGPSVAAREKQSVELKPVLRADARRAKPLASGLTDPASAKVTKNTGTGKQPVRKTGTQPRAGMSATSDDDDVIIVREVKRNAATVSQLPSQQGQIPAQMPAPRPAMTPQQRAFNDEIIAMITQKQYQMLLMPQYQGFSQMQLHEEAKRLVQQDLIAARRADMAAKGGHARASQGVAPQPAQVGNGQESAAAGMRPQAGAIHLPAQHPGYNASRARVASLGGRSAVSNINNTTTINQKTNPSAAAVNNGQQPAVNAHQPGLAAACPVHRGHVLRPNGGGQPAAHVPAAVHRLHLGGNAARGVHYGNPAVHGGHQEGWLLGNARGSGVVPAASSPPRTPVRGTPVPVQGQFPNGFTTPYHRRMDPQPYLTPSQTPERQLSGQVPSQQPQPRQAHVGQQWAGVRTPVTPTPAAGVQNKTTLRQRLDVPWPAGLTPPGFPVCPEDVFTEQDWARIQGRRPN